MSNTFIAVGNPSPYTDSTGQVWAADNGVNASGGTTFHSTTAVSGTPDPTLYQFGRSGSGVSCTASLPVGLYTLTLKFADVLGFTLPGQQIFNVLVNGVLLKPDFDVFATVEAQNVAYDLVFTNFANLTGTISVQVQQVAPGSQGAQLQAVSFVQTISGGVAWNQITNKPFATATDFNFASQTPGGSLAIGVNTILLQPVPAGVNGTDANHYLYISNGVGAPEAVLISGGTAVSGAASGTVVVTCASTHSGAWTIGSATAGIQEAIQSLPASSGSLLSPVTGGGVVTAPTGSYLLYASVYLRTGITLLGAGPGSKLVVMTANQTAVTTALKTTQFAVSDLTIQVGGSLSNMTGINISSGSMGVVENILIWGPGLSDTSTGVILQGQLNPDMSFDINNDANQNIFRNITIVGVTRGIRFLGVIGGLGSTQNRFDDIVMNIGTGPGIDFVGGTDTNFFYNTYIGYSGVLATDYAIVFNSGNPGVNNAVGGNRFYGLHTGAGLATPIQIKFNWTENNHIFGYTNVGATTPFALTSHSLDNVIVGMTGSGDTNNTRQYWGNLAKVMSDDGTGILFPIIEPVNGTLLLGDGSHGVQVASSANIVGPLIAPAAGHLGSMNFIVDTGATNAIAGTDPYLTLVAGLRVRVKLTNTLQAGANTFNMNSTSALAIKSHRNPANNISTAYAVGGVIELLYDGTQWQDMSQ